MSTIRPRARALRNAAHTEPRFHLADLGVYGFDRHETTILAALVTEDPLLLVGRSGTGKTFLLNTLSEALGLEHRHYNASLISFDDLVGFPYPDEAHTTVRFLETPATVWGAESVLIDEISRCKPEHQNRLFSLVHERRLQGLLLKRLRYRWAAMNPCTSDQGGTEDYSPTGANSRPGNRQRLSRRRVKASSRRRIRSCDRHWPAGGSNSSSRPMRAPRR
jgi:MoxR-like ATPase